MGLRAVRGALALSSRQALGTARFLLPAWTTSPILLCLWDLSSNPAQSYSLLSFMALSGGAGTPIPTQPYPTGDGFPELFRESLASLQRPDSP